MPIWCGVSYFLYLIDAINSYGMGGGAVDDEAKSVILQLLESVMVRLLLAFY